MDALRTKLEKRKKKNGNHSCSKRMPKAKKLNLLNDTREQTGEQIREAYMMEDIADTFRHESNV